MNQFIAEIKVAGEWQQVSAVFPFSIGELLDERLDEANLTIFDGTKVHTPLTECRISFVDSAKQYNFIIANDNSSEYPAGSGRYKHQVYLLERTKLLDGILAPSITFTNSLGNNYSPIRRRVFAESYNPTQPLPTGFYGVQEIVSPISSDDDYIVPSVYTVGTAVANQADENDTLSRITYTPSYSQGASTFTSGCDIYLDGLLFQSSVNEAYTIPKNNLKGVSEIRLDYTVCVLSIVLLSGTVSYYRYYVRFIIQTFDNVLPIKRYTITDCVNRVLELSEPLGEGENPRFTFDGITYTDGVASAPAPGSQAEKYSKVYAPELSITDSTLREQLKVIGGYIHAEPWLDENDVVRFLDYGRTEQSPKISVDSEYVSKSYKTDINQYCTDIRSNAQNLVSSLGYAKGTIIEPAGGMYRSLRSETMYVRINADTGIASTDLPIFTIEKVLCGIVETENPLNQAWALDPVDITPYVFEATEYGSNLSSQSGGYPYSKSYAIYYTQGQKGLHGLFYRDPDAVSSAAFSKFAITNILYAASGTLNLEAIETMLSSDAADLVFQITYKPVTSALISHGKQYYISDEVPFTQIYNQSDNLVETEFYGEMMKGVAARLGNVEQQRTYLLSSASDIPNVGDMIDEYAISAVSCEYMPHYVKCTVGLSKDFNRISQYVGINSIKRMYEISGRQVQARRILLKEILLISDNETISDDGTFFKDLKPITNIFVNHGTVEIFPVCAAEFKGYNKNGTEISPDKFILPCIGRTFGNGMHFSFAMKDNYSAGDISQYVNANDVTGNFQNDAKYTDFYGRIYWAQLALLSKTAAHDFLANQASYTLPVFNNATQEYVARGKHRLRKDSREAISYNIELEFKTDQQDIIIGPGMASRCTMLGSSGTRAPQFYITTRDIGKFEKTFTPITDSDLPDVREDRGLLEFSVLTEDPKGIKISVYPSYITEDSLYKSWVIFSPLTTETVDAVDEDGNTITETITTGGEIILTGSLKTGFVSDPETGLYNRTLYFSIKK